MASTENISLSDIFNLYMGSDKAIVVQNISDDTERDVLESYLAAILNRDLTGVHYPADVSGCCIVVVKWALKGLRRYCKAIQEQPLVGNIELSALGPCDGVLIRNPPSQIRIEELKGYLCSEEFTGETNNPVKEIKLCSQGTGPIVIVLLSEISVTSRILNRPAERFLYNLDIDPYFPAVHDALLQHSESVYSAHRENHETETTCNAAVDKFELFVNPSSLYQQDETPLEPPKTSIDTCTGDFSVDTIELPMVGGSLQLIEKKQESSITNIFLGGANDQDFSEKGEVSVDSFEVIPEGPSSLIADEINLQPMQSTQQPVNRLSPVLDDIIDSEKHTKIQPVEKSCPNVSCIVEETIADSWHVEPVSEKNSILTADEMSPKHAEVIQESADRFYLPQDEIHDSERPTEMHSDEESQPNGSRIAEPDSQLRPDMSCMLHVNEQPNSDEGFYSLPTSNEASVEIVRPKRKFNKKFQEYQHGLSEDVAYQLALSASMSEMGTDKWKPNQTRPDETTTIRIIEDEKTFHTTRGQMLFGDKQSRRSNDDKTLMFHTDITSNARKFADDGLFAFATSGNGPYSDGKGKASRFPMGQESTNRQNRPNKNKQLLKKYQSGKSEDEALSEALERSMSETSFRQPERDSRNHRRSSADQRSSKRSSSSESAFRDRPIKLTTRKQDHNRQWLAADKRHRSSSLERPSSQRSYFEPGARAKSNGSFEKVLPKRKNVSDSARKKIGAILKQKHVKSFEDSNSKGFVLQGKEDDVKDAYTEILQILLDDTQGLEASKAQRASRKREFKRKPEIVTEYMATNEPEVPEYWEKFHQGLISHAIESIQLFFKGKDYFKVKLQSNDVVYKAIEKLIHNTWDEKKLFKALEHGRDATGLKALGYRRMRVTMIQRIENLHLYESYARKRKRMFMDLYSRRKRSCRTVEEIPDSRGSIGTQNISTYGHVIADELFQHVNEHFFFHGTSENFVDIICDKGFDFRLGSQNSMYGQGIYGAESPTKADQYADMSDKRSKTNRKMFLMRMCLGECFLCTAPNPHKYRRPPCANTRHLKDDCTNTSHGSFDSVIGQAPNLLFREFVVYDRDQCYPEYLITYDRV